MEEALQSSAEIVRIPLEPAARLRAAVRMLSIRLAEQGEVISNWRADADALALATRDLATSLKSCQRNLDALGVKLAAARAAGLELERTADRLPEGAGQD